MSTIKTPIIIEGFWNVGKTSLAKYLQDTHGYLYIPEPNHENSGIKNNISNWYTNHHNKRFDQYCNALGNDTKVVMERSILSSAAFDYAQGRNYKSSSFLSFVNSLNKNILFIFLYQDLGHINKRKYDIGNKKVICKLRSPSFAKRYDGFFRTVLPLKWGIVPLFIKQPKTYRESTAKNNCRIIERAIGNNRLGQVNIVCFYEQKDIEFLLLKRSKEKGGFWQTISGGIKLGEYPKQTALREIEEEIGVAPDPEKIIDTSYHYSFIGKEGYELNEYVFGYKLKDNKIICSAEHVESRFTAKAEAKKMIKFDTNIKSLKYVENAYRKERAKRPLM